MTSLFELFEKFKPGEIVIIFYSPFSPHYNLFRSLLTYSKERGLDVIIDDALDMLHVYKTNMEYFGIDTKDIEDVKVIKVGGLREVGKILEKVNVDEDAAFHLEKYSEVFNKVLERFDLVLNIVLGFDKLLAFYSGSQQDLNVILLALRHFLGNKKRIAVYFLNEDLVTKIPGAVEFLEDSASTVLRLEKNEKWVLKVLKSPNIELLEKEIEIASGSES